MASDVDTSIPNNPDIPEHIEMPAATVWPMILAVGVCMLGTGLVTNLALSLLGLALFLTGLIGWLRQLFPGHGVTLEPVKAEHLPRPIEGQAGRVETLGPGRAGYRMHLPEMMHPYSAGIRGGIIGGLVMPIPAIFYSLISTGRPWLAINLLAGMLLPGVEQMSGEELRQFHFGLFFLALVIHAVISVGLGLVYGVILPMFPGRPIFWGGLVLPLLWTGGSYGFMGAINPALQEHVDWFWFILSQIVYGVVASVVVMRSERVLTQPMRRVRATEPPSGDVLRQETDAPPAPDQDENQPGGGM
ncbi:MAG: hypothetical protein ACK4RK_18905 [Gemmataceae bacterium]